MTNSNQAQIEATLQRCDLYLASVILTGHFQGRYMSSELASLLDAYCARPDIDTALPLASFAPSLLALFEQATNRSSFASQVLHRKSRAVVAGLSRAIHPTGPAELLCDAYSTATDEICCEESCSRLYFEFLCFAAFYASFVAPEFVGRRRRRWLSVTVEPDLDACHVFHQCLSAVLACHCEGEGLRGRDGSGTAAAPDRLRAYGELIVKGSGPQGLLRAYGKYTGGDGWILQARCSLCAGLLVTMAQSAMRKAFG